MPRGDFVFDRRPALSQQRALAVVKVIYQVNERSEFSGSRSKNYWVRDEDEILHNWLYPGGTPQVKVGSSQITGSSPHMGET